MKNRFGLVALALLLAATPAFAEELDAALGRMARSSGDAYLAARANVLARPEARAELDARLEKAAWTDESFETLAMATIARAHLAHPEVVRRVDKLQGIDPAVYLLRRRPEPECAREILNLGGDAAGPLLELYLKTFDRRAFTTPESLPELARSKDPAVLAALERVALRTGIVFGLAESRHPAALFVCKAVVRDAKESQAVRLQAAEGLGAIGTADALGVLRTVHGNVEESLALRLAAVRGIARIPSDEALGFLEGRLLETSSDEERRAVVVALGTFGSAWAWESRGPELAKKGDALRARASATLVGALARVDADAAVDAITTIAHPDAKPLLERVATDPAAKDETRATARRAIERLEVALERNR